MLLPMPPIPSSVKRRHCSCTIHWVSSATSTSRPTKWLTSRASTRSTCVKAAGSTPSWAAGIPAGGESWTGRAEASRSRSQASSSSTFWCAALLLLAPGGKGLLVHPQGNELFEAFGFRVAQAPFPLCDGAPGGAKPLGQACLGQPDGGAQRQHQLSEGIVSLTVHMSLHERSPDLAWPGAATHFEGM